MSRLAETFERLKESGAPGLVTDVTAGDPELDRTAAVLEGLDRAGAVASIVARIGEMQVCDLSFGVLGLIGGVGDCRRGAFGRALGSAPCPGVEARRARAHDAVTRFG